MSYLIRKIGGLTIPEIGSYPYYFVDTNVWLDYLAYMNSGLEPKNSVRPYFKFIDTVFRLHNKNIPQAKYKPKFAINSNLMNEIITSYLFRFAKKKYNSDKELSLSNKEYRNNPSTDYSIQLKKVINRFMDYSSIISVWNENNDEFGAGMIKNFLNAFSGVTHCDFNDFFYNHLCSGRKIPIVTNDGDFLFKNSIIFTNNKELIKLSSVDLT